MIFDNETHRNFLLELLTSDKLTIPFSGVDLVVEVREAVRSAAVAVPAKDADD